MSENRSTDMPDDRMAVAVIGMAGRFPKADNPDELWARVRAKKECLSTFTDEELLASGADQAAIRDPNYVKVGGVLEDVELFDADYFGINPREAQVLDPQHRLFLECAVQALEDAGVDPETYEGLIGVYAGTDFSSYGLHNLLTNPNFPSGLEVEAALGNMQDTLCTRTSHRLNLRGPTYTVQTNCSTSLVAVHIAAQAVMNGETDVALAGGAFVTVPTRVGYIYQPGGIASSDGCCRSFDARADGAPYGHGVALVALKRLEDAWADGDRIYGLILGSAINNDGSDRVGFSAPSVSGQSEVVLEALANADVDPETIQFLMCHGSGTKVGDPIEIAALNRAYRQHTDKKGYVPISSVKPNLGHLDRAAGVTNLIVALQALRHREIPPCLHFTEANPEIDFASGPFYVNEELREWPEAGTPRRAGVSALGIGGTNAHVIVEEAPEISTTTASRPHQLVLVSARTPTALDAATANLAAHLREHPTLDLADVCFTLQRGRTAHVHRRMLVASDLADAAEALESVDPRRLLSAATPIQEQEVVFMFPGLGDHYVDMGRELYREEKRFRETVDRCAEILEPVLGLDLRTVLYPPSKETPEPAASEASRSGPDLRRMLGRAGATESEASRRLNETRLIHPVLFVVEYAMAQVWIEWGVRPGALIGYSIGEIVAACVAGVLSLEDALLLIARRAQMIAELPPGAMLAVPLSEEEAAVHLSGELSLSAINGATLTVIGGPLDAVAELEARLAEQDVGCRRLATSHAFHSSMMQPAAARLRELVASLQLRPPEIPFVSTVTGTWISEEQAVDPDYWVDHLSKPVRFGQGVLTMWENPARLLLEVGPGQSLGSLALQNQPATEDAGPIVVSSMPNVYDRHSDQAFLFAALGKLYLAGIDVDWQAFYEGERRQKVELPTYPFERRRFWLDLPSDAPPTRMYRKPDPGEWYWIPLWQQSAILPIRDSYRNCQREWLIFADPYGFGERLAARLRETGHGVTTVTMGDQYRQEQPRSFVLRPAQPKDYVRLFRDLPAKPTNVLHGWSISLPIDTSEILGSIRSAQDRGFYSVLFLTQALGTAVTEEDVKVHIVTTNVHKVVGGDAICPENAPIVGMAKAIPKEYRNLRSLLVDVDVRDVEGPAAARLAEQVLDEAVTPTQEEPVAYRQGLRWKRVWEFVRLDPEIKQRSPLRGGGVFLLTGGLGGLGLGLAEYFARQGPVKICLVGRSGLLDRGAWSQWLAEHDEDDSTSYKIRQVRKLEDLGAEVMIAAADVTDLEQMKAVVAEARNRFGPIDGVVHLAGVPGAGIIALKTREMADKVLNCKLEGTLILDEIFRDDQSLRFMAYYSSMTGVLTGFGEVDYSAANNFLDAFAFSVADRRPYPTVSINWPAWLWDAWQGELLEAMPELHAMIVTGRKRYGLTFEEGTDAFDRALSSGFPQVLVTTQNLTVQIGFHRNWSMYGVMADLDGESTSHGRPATLRNPYVAPKTENHRRVARIWQDFIGVDEIGIHDNFFDLGGHSLLGMEIIGKLRETFDVEIGMAVLYGSPTIAEMVEFVEQARSERQAA